MAFGDRIRAYGKPTTEVRPRTAPAPAPTFDWPQGDPPSDIPTLKDALRRAWRLQHLDHDSTPEERAEADEIVKRFGDYCSSLELELGVAAAVYFMRCVMMEPKSKPKEATK
jgi:hypothetical protein